MQKWTYVDLCSDNKLTIQTHDNRTFCAKYELPNQIKLTPLSIEGSLLFKQITWKKVRQHIDLSGLDDVIVTYPAQIPNDLTDFRKVVSSTVYKYFDHKVHMWLHTDLLLLGAVLADNKNGSISLYKSFILLHRVGDYFTSGFFFDGQVYKVKRIRINDIADLEKQYTLLAVSFKNLGVPFPNIINIWSDDETTINLFKFVHFEVKIIKTDQIIYGFGDYINQLRSWEARTYKTDLPKMKDQEWKKYFSIYPLFEGARNGLGFLGIIRHSSNISRQEYKSIRANLLQAAKKDRHRVPIIFKLFGMNLHILKLYRWWTNNYDFGNT